MRTTKPCPECDGRGTIWLPLTERTTDCYGCAGYGVCDMPTGLNDPFDDMFEELERDIGPIDTSDEEAFDVSGKTLPQLHQMLTEMTTELKALKEVFHPKTQRGRDLHSQHVAIVVAMNNYHGDRNDPGAGAL